jgi:DNA-binding NarL/FixJ family response regulator
MIKILLIEDHPVVIEGVTKILQEINSVETIEWVSTGKEALEYIDIYNPNLILLDINLPDINGIELCQIINKKYPFIKIIGLSSYNQKSYIDAMLKKGASGYILKNATSEEIKSGISEVLSGKIHLCEEAFSIINNNSKKKENRPFLTPREKEVLLLISDGMTNQEIADKLFISHLTVDSHRKNLLLKLNTRNTASLIKTAYEMGYLN